MFYGAPGRKLFTTVGGGPIRGAHTANGTGYVVSGPTLYSVTGAGLSTELGFVPGDGRVQIVHNDTQVVVMTNAGWVVWNVPNQTLGTVSGAPTTGQGTYQDSYIVFPLENGTYGWTAISDATSLDGLNFASAEAQPDPIIAILSDHRELWLFGTQTTEIAQTSGDADLVFTRTAMLEYGCCAKYTPAKSNNTVFWLGQNESGTGVVYQAEGYSPERISTHALETAIATYGDLTYTWGFCYQQNGHTFYILSFPGFATWAWDASARRWSQLTYRNASTGVRERQRDNAYMFIAGKHIVGDYESGKLYQLDLDTYTDDGNVIERERAWAVIESENKWLRHNSIEIIGEMGVGLETIIDPTPGANPKWRLSWSDDGCRNYSNEREIDMGKIGHYRQRGQIQRLGLSRRRVYRLRTTDPVRIAVYGANLNVTGGVK
jgi:hypothetical protein